MHALAVTAPRLRAGVTWLVGPRGAPLGERVVAFLTAAFVVVGLLLRARGYLWNPTAFWLDEASWAMNIVEQPLLELCIRPIGFMWVSRELARVFSLSEPVLRFMPWFAGMATVVMAPALARRLFVNPAARLLFVAIIALHPVAIDFSKEFKPYSISLTLHLLLMLLTLRYLDTRRGRDLAWLLAAATLGGLFAQDLVFAYPGVFLLSGWTSLGLGRRHVIAVVSVAGLIIAILLLQYHFSWSKNPPSDTRVWGNKYNVFYEGRHSYAAWVQARHESMAEFPAFRHKFWQGGFLTGRRADFAREVDNGLWICLHLLGLLVIAIWRRQRAILLVLPVALVWLFNFLRLWPIGAFRANLFIVGYMSAIACMAFDAPRREVAKLVDAIPAFVIVLAPFLFLDAYWSNHKQALTYASEFPKVVRTLLRVKLMTDGAVREPLVLDRRSCDPFRYYTEFHPSFSKQFNGAVHAAFDTRCVPEETHYRHDLVANTPRAPLHVWTILHTARQITSLMRHHLLGDAQQTYVEKIGPHWVMAFQRPHEVETVEPSSPAAGPTPVPAGSGAVPDEETPEDSPASP
jgi:hypothetical protein